MKNYPRQKKFQVFVIFHHKRTQKMCENQMQTVDKASCLPTYHTMKLFKFEIFKLNKENKL